MEQNTITPYKKVLVITYAFPPLNISAVHRPLNIVKFLPHYAWTPIVVTPKKNTEPLDTTLNEKIPEGTTINEVFSINPDNILGIIKSKKSQNRIDKLSFEIIKIAINFYRFIYDRLVIVDWHDGWIPFGLAKSLKILKEHNIDLIYVHGEPPCSFVIGYLLKKLSRKPLVMDYDDSWTTSVIARKAKGIKSKFRSWLEHKILKSANIILSVKESTINEILNTYSDIKKTKFLLVTNGYDPEDFKGIRKKEKSTKFSITYTGRISEKFYYSPESFLKALFELIKEKKISKEDIIVNFIGSISQTYIKRFEKLVRYLGLSEVVRFLGHLEHRKTIEYQVNSDLLLYLVESLEGKNASMNYSGVLPAKLFEYLYAGVPILAIVPPGFEQDLIKKTKTGFIAEPNNVNSVKKELNKIISMFKNNQLQLERNYQEIKKYDRKLLTKKVANVFNKNNFLS